MCGRRRIDAKESRCDRGREQAHSPEFGRCLVPWIPLWYSVYNSLENISDWHPEWNSAQAPDWYILFTAQSILCRRVSAQGTPGLSVKVKGMAVVYSQRTLWSSPCALTYPSRIQGIPTPPPPHTHSAFPQTWPSIPMFKTGYKMQLEKIWTRCPSFILSSPRRNLKPWNCVANPFCQITGAFASPRQPTFNWETGSKRRAVLRLRSRKGITLLKMSSTELDKWLPEPHHTKNMHFWNVLIKECKTLSTRDRYWTFNQYCLSFS